MSLCADQLISVSLNEICTSGNACCVSVLIRNGFQISLLRTASLL